MKQSNKEGTLQGTMGEGYWFFGVDYGMVT